MVTGASSGIGRSVAIECSKSGAQLIITGRHKERLEQTYNQLDGENHQQIIADLSNDEGIQTIVSLLPALDGIVHSAGIVKPKPFAYLNRNELDEIMNINFYGPTLLTNGLMRKKLLNRNASIVFISSISGVTSAFIGGSAYGGSKGAINGMVKCLALELASKKIRVNTISPGMVESNLLDGSGVSNQDLIKDRQHYPLGRYGKPEDVAYAAIYLLSEASSWVTGTSLLLDGGYTLN